jgi:hypothetical protein|tara:strand:+ start:1017 stop:1127 length:111 start_codon:yes stop_codon:yes gene_type:complete
MKIEITEELALGLSIVILIGGTFIANWIIYGILSSL